MSGVVGRLGTSHGIPGGLAVVADWRPGVVGLVGGSLSWTRGGLVIEESSRALCVGEKSRRRAREVALMEEGESCATWGTGWAWPCGMSDEFDPNKLGLQI